jgi:hypothetical protein
VSVARRALTLCAYVAPLVIASSLGIPVCPQALLTRMPCPGCGMTRALAALVSGDLHTALTWNPISIVVWPVALPLAGYHAMAYVLTGKSRLNARWTRRVGVTLSAALAVVWMMRIFGAFGGPVAL